MSGAAHAHEPVGGALLNRATRILLALAVLGGLAAIWRFASGLGAVSNLNDGYPWGIWIALDVVVGTALGCGGYAVALLVYVLNQGRYHPLVRPAVLTSLLGYGLAVFAVAVDLGRPWELWKVPVYFWRWSHSPQLEVALCVATYVLVLLVEMAPALLERQRRRADGRPNPGVARLLDGIEKGLPFILALGMLLPTMHQSSLGTMMLLPGPRLHALWFTPWLPFLFLVSCLVMGYGIVVVEAAFSSWAFRRERHTAMLADLSKVAMWVTAFWVVFRLGDVAIAGKLGQIAGGRGAAFVAEILLHAAAVVVLLSPARRAHPVWQVRAGMLLVLAGAVYRVNTYLVAFRPGEHWSYFPALPEMAITVGLFSFEAVLYLWAVRRFPILAGRPAVAR